MSDAYSVLKILKRKIAGHPVAQYLDIDIESKNIKFIMTPGLPARILELSMESGAENPLRVCFLDFSAKDQAEFMLDDCFGIDRYGVADKDAASEMMAFLEALLKPDFSLEVKKMLGVRVYVIRSSVKMYVSRTSHVYGLRSYVPGSLIRRWGEQEFFKKYS